jgi:hypothetical protein
MYEMYAGYETKDKDNTQTTVVANSGLVLEGLSRGEYPRTRSSPEPGSCFLIGG